MSYLLSPAMRVDSDHTLARICDTTHKDAAQVGESRRESGRREACRHAEPICAAYI